MTVKTDLLKKYITDYINNNIKDFEINESDIVNTIAINVLIEIQNIIRETEISDFEKIEKIVCLFEENMIDAGSCYDFGWECINIKLKSDSKIR